MNKEIKGQIITWLLYIIVVLITVLYERMRGTTEWLWILPFIIICVVLSDWASLRVKFVLGRKSE